ncbi:hypothetical protein NDS46_30670 (plasmid) [Paenibacillus thiaminolyticus]|uniref:hypothetical protein n=1 Tax=Paenibacillus thiaminolyticus TaxID=49283 RepID=UPI00232B24BA|nr:hypothetical protein [Paenibacillus thiaminolyticus]WCF11712.1 hypothetical protein NDS46_30670 [Paenibacillus thiaminolyticus]
MSKTDEAFKSILSSLFDSLTADSEKEVIASFGEEIESLIDSKPELKDPETYNIFVNHKVDDILGVLVHKLMPIDDPYQQSKLYFLYKHYCLISNNLTKVICQKEGFACAVDKSRWVITQYQKYILEGKLPDMTIHEKCYWKPRSGTGKQWIDLCEGLYSLYQGNPEPYLLAMKEMMIS